MHFFISHFVFKGQLILKCLFDIVNSPQKTNKQLRLYYFGASSQIVFVHFLGELKTPKRQFEINWHLEGSQLIFSAPKKLLQIKAGQNNKYNITKTSGLVQVWFYHWEKKMEKGIEGQNVPWESRKWKPKHIGFW